MRSSRASTASRIFSFASDVDAAAFVDVATDQVLADPAPYSGTAEVSVTGFPRPARALSYTWDYGNGQLGTGFRTFAQGGTLFVSVELDSVGGVPLEGVADVTVIQIACLLTTEPCAAIELPGILNAA
jgi:hypothetical protein